MKKFILIISALAFASGLFAASPAETGQALYTACNDLYAANSARLKIATASGDKAAIAQAKADNTAASAAFRTENLASVQSLLSDIDAIATVNPNVATWAIKFSLNAKNIDPATGKTLPVFDQDADDAGLARKLLTIGTGGQSYYYYQYYATADELNALDGSGTGGIYLAGIRRAKALGILADFAPVWNAKHLGQGIVESAFVKWFNGHAKKIADTNKGAAIDLLAKEQTAVSLLPNQTAATNKRIDDLRKQIALLKEVK
ncbi:hypothetical protein OPIT5_03785 [Opitutaceae bacterium TAV5]|nr:hypothetical protein OPIT5_03785 [Opitutaceae bacterium TAV5]